jgi:magnesium chelatase subunit D
MDYERDPNAFAESWSRKEEELCRSLEQAQSILASVTIPDAMLEMIVQICIETGVDGHRADITMIKTAVTTAAFHGRTSVTEEDVREAAGLVLSHRIRRRPLSDRQMDPEKLEETIRKARPAEQKTEAGDSPRVHGKQDEQQPDASSVTLFEEGKSFPLEPSAMKNTARPDALVRDGNGRRSTTESRDGKYVRSRIPARPTRDIAFDATLRAAASRRKEGRGHLAVSVRPEDIREKVRERKTGNTLLFVVDASGSMGVRQRMTAVKGAILSLLIDAYQKRDRVGLVAFRGTGAEVLLPPTRSVELARTCLRSLPTGGKTPLARGLLKGLEVIERERMIHQDVLPLMILVSDGKANIGMGSGLPFDEARLAAARIREAHIPSVVIDPEQGFLQFGMAEHISSEMGGKYLKIGDLSPETLTDVIRMTAG